MDERKRLALTFKVDRNWMGGTYYVLNIINALKTLPEEVQPEIILLCQSKSDFDYAKSYTGYPLLDYRLTFQPSKLDLPIRIINKLWRSIAGHNLLATHRFNEKVDAVYPVMNRYQISTKSPKIYWIPDFQEHYLPEFFSKEMIKFRDLQVRDIIADEGHIVFSSNDAKASFEKFYPEGRSLRTDVFHFTTTLGKPVWDSRKLVGEKFAAPDRFFYCPNQFWMHKNHLVLFEAIKILKNRGINVCVFCSGGTKDYRNPDYFASLSKYISDNGLESNIRILGFIDREDQLALLQECGAIIQPSLFEGWSTSVEEAKALGKFMILSDLPLLKEQVTDNGFFFRRNSTADLAHVIAEFLRSGKEARHIDYSDSVCEAARNFMDIILAQND